MSSQCLFEGDLDASAVPHGCATRSGSRTSVKCSVASMWRGNDLACHYCQHADHWDVWMFDLDLIQVPEVGILRCGMGFKVLHLLHCNHLMKSFVKPPKIAGTFPSCQPPRAPQYN